MLGCSRAGQELFTDGLLCKSQSFKSLARLHLGNLGPYFGSCSFVLCSENFPFSSVQGYRSRLKLGIGFDEHFSPRLFNCLDPNLRGM